MRFFIRAAASMLAVISVQAVAEGDASAGQAKSAICAACHGADGNSMVPNWPKLAGQHAEYLERQINLIKSGSRTVVEMSAFVSSLSDQDIQDIAAWYSSQTNSGGVADLESATVLGQRIYKAGNAETSLPACMSCHGPAGEGNPLSGYPVLAGQHAAYTGKMLTAFRSGDHWGDDDEPSEVMNGVAAQLSTEEINAVASYIQGLYLDLD